MCAPPHSLQCLCLVAVWLSWQFWEHVGKNLVKCFTHISCSWGTDLVLAWRILCSWSLEACENKERGHYYAAFRLACRSQHYRFDDDICTTAQAPLAAEGWPSGKQQLANRLITLPLCPPRQIAESWILFNSGAMPLSDKAKAAWPLRAATLKQQTMIIRRSGKAAS